MKYLRTMGKWLLPLALLFYFWLFPEALFRGCVRAVVQREQETDLTQEEYRELFDIERSEYKIVWKFMGND